ncbi:RloB-like protein [Malaciobacter marinus]|jgi:hypothetical protein|uniref:RloB-like protein n=1 Tax=Malaciobacter marinus TaxID=505249 RepID=A0AB36ZX70_9BACT|nr:RloB family protein [Malaciobacter marinus]PPK61942.1 RloB-like protein [Malaciobacter marinus]SKB25759.1 RloB-like protein [Malaciobacter marinus]
MGRRRGGDKLHNKKKELEKKDFQRKTNNKITVPDVIIACEDSVSSPMYFQKIIDKLIEEKKITQDSFVIAKHKHTNPTGVLEDLKNYSDENNKKYTDFEHKWIVIDRDKERVNGGGHKKEDFNNALKNAKSKKKHLNIEVAYSNDSFELWYLLHFNYRDTAILRDEIIKKVIEELKKVEPYKFFKLNKDNIKEENYTKMIFETLFNRQKSAINNAKKLLDTYGISHTPEEDNPSTRVHVLVEILNNLGAFNK